MSSSKNKHDDSSNDSSQGNTGLAKGDLFKTIFIKIAKPTPFMYYKVHAPSTTAF